MAEASRGARRIHYESEGEGPAVLLIPGLGSGRRLFGTLPRRFAKDGFRALSVDPVGVAPSSPQEGAYDLMEAAADLHAVLDDAGVEDVALVGTSLGGKVGLCAASLSPARVRRLVMLASSAVSSPRSKRIYRFFEVLAQRLEPGELAEIMAAFLFGRSFQAERAQVVEDIVRGMRFDAPTRELMIAQARCLQAFDGESLAAELQVPTLCVAGLEDSLTGVDEVRRTAAALPQSELVELDGAGHSLLLETAEAYRLVREAVSA